MSAHFVDGLDIGAEATSTSLAAANGLERGGVEAYLRRPESKTVLDDAKERARRLGITGVCLAENSPRQM